MDPYELVVRKQLGLDEPEEEGRDWFQPIRTFFGATQGVIPRALSQLYPETYARAQREAGEMLQVSPEAPWYEQVEAAPGAGDVIAAAIPEEVKASLPGRVIGPAARLVANILGDPTTYTPAIMGKVAGALAKGTRGAEVLATAREVARDIPIAAQIDVARGIPVATETVAKAVDTARKVGIGEAARAIAETSPTKARAFLTAHAIREAQPWAEGAAAAVAYGPQVVRGGIASAKATAEAWSEGETEEAIASGANTIFMAGLATLMGKGIISVGQAREALTTKLASDGIIPTDLGRTAEIGPERIPRAGLAGQAGELERRFGVEGPGFMMYRPKPPTDFETLLEETRAAGPPPEVPGLRRTGPLSRQLLTPEDLLGFRGRVEPGVEPGPVSPFPEGFEAPGVGVRVPPGARGPGDAEVAARIAAETERARALAGEAAARAGQPMEAAGRLPEMGPAEEERLAALAIEPEQFLGTRRPAPLQTHLPLGVEPPRPAEPMTPRELAVLQERIALEDQATAARRARAKGKQLTFEREYLEGPVISKPPSVAERAAAARKVAEEARAAEKAREEAAVREALDKEPDQYLRMREEETEKAMTAELQAYQSRGSKAGFAARQRAFMLAAGMRREGKLPTVEEFLTNPESAKIDRKAKKSYGEIYREMRDAAETEAGQRVDAQLRNMFRTAQGKPEFMPAERLRAARGDFEERVAIQEEGGKPAPPEAVAPAPAAEVIPPAAEAAPSVREAAAPAPAAAEVVTPSTPEVRVKRSPEQWAKSTIGNQRNPEMKAALEARKDEVAENIRRVFDEDLKEKQKLGLPIPVDVREAEDYFRRMAYRATNEIITKIREEPKPKVEPTVVKPTVAAEVAEELAGPAKGPAVGITKGAARGEIDTGLTGASATRATTVGPGRVPRAAKVDEVLAAIDMWQTKEPKATIEDLAKKTLAIGEPLKIAAGRKFNSDDLARWTRYLQLLREGSKSAAAEKQVAQEFGKAPGTIATFITRMRKDTIEKARKEAAEAVGVELPTKAAAPVKDEGQLVALMQEKQGIDRRLQKLVKFAEESEEDFLARVQKEDVAGFLEDYVRFAGRRPMEALRGRPGQVMGDRLLRQFAADLGVDVGVKPPTDRLIRRIAEKLGLDPERFAVPKAKAAAKPVETRVKPIPEGWAGDPHPNAPKGQLVGAGGTKVLTRGDIYDVQSMKSPEGLAEDLKSLADSELVDGITIDIPMKSSVRADVLSKMEGRLTEEVVDKEGGVIYRVNRTKATGELEVRDPIRTERMPRADEQLSALERARKHSHYGDDIRNGVDLGDGTKVVDPDRRSDPGFVSAVASMSRKVSTAMRGVVEDLVGLIGPKTRVQFGGITTSPYMRGIYIEGTHGGAVFANVVEAVFVGKDRNEAARRIVDALIHETAHVAQTTHEGRFIDMAKYVEDLVKAQGKYDGYVKTVEEGLEHFDRIKKELVPEFEEMRRTLNAESWRGAEAEAVEGVSPRAATGGAAAKSNLAGGGAKAPPGGGAHGLRPGGAVLRGGEGEAGRLRPAAAAGEAPAPVPAEGGAVGPGAGRGADIDALIGRIREVAELETEEGRLTERGAFRILDDLVKSKVLAVPAATQRVMSFVDSVVDRMTDAEKAKWAKAAPDPRERPGVMEGAYNTLHMAGVDDDTKARITLFGNWMTDLGLLKRSEPLPWEKVGREVQALLGVRTPEEYVHLYRHKGGGMTPVDMYLLSTISNHYAKTMGDARTRFTEAVAAGETAKADTLFKAWKDAEQNMEAAVVLTIDRSTEAARTLGIRRATAMTADPQTLMYTQMRANLVEMLRTRLDKERVEGEADRLMAEIKRIRDSGEHSFGEFQKLYNQIVERKMWPDKILEWYKMGLLGWPSEVANLGGNSLLRGVRFVEDMVASSLDAVRSKLTGKEREITIGESAAGLLALRRAGVEGFGKWADAIARAFKLEGGDALAALERGSLAEDLMLGPGAIGGKFGNLVRFHGDVMQATDVYFKLLSMTDTLYRETYRKVRKGVAGFEARPGERLLEATERIVGELRDNHAKALRGEAYSPALIERFKPMFEKAVEVAQRDTFQEELPNWARGIQTMFREHKAWQFAIPFFRTPLNIARETLIRTPAGFFTLYRKWSKMTDAERMTELSKPLTGSAIMAGIFGLASTGEITGGGPVDYEAQEALRAIGWQPYSIKIGDQWISYQRLEPIAALAGMAADLAEGIRSGDFENVSTGGQRAASLIAENLTNKTFLSGLDGVTSAISNPKQSLGRFVKQIQGSAVPNSLGFVPVGHMARALDPIYRQTDPFTLTPFVAKIPGLSETLPPQYGPTGEERMRPGSLVERLISPVARQKAETGVKARGTEEIVKLDAVPRTPMRYWTSPQGYRVYLKPEERQLLAKSLNEAITIIGERLVKDPGYQRMPKDEMDPNYQYGQKTRQQVAKRLIEKYRARALKQIMPALKARSREAYREREL